MGLLEEFGKGMGLQNQVAQVQLGNAAVAAAGFRPGQYVSARQRREAILEAKRLILGKYNFWHQVIGVVERSGARLKRRDAASMGGRIYARKELRKHNLSAALEDGWAHLRRFVGARFGIMTA